MTNTTNPKLDDVLNNFYDDDGTMSNRIKALDQAKQTILSDLLAMLPEKHTSHEHCVITGQVGSMTRHEEYAKQQVYIIEQVEAAIRAYVGVES